LVLIHKLRGGLDFDSIGDTRIEHVH